MYKSLPLLLFFVVVLAGCRSRLIGEHTVSLDPGQSRTVTVDPISKARTVKVSATATTGEVNVYLLMEKDQAEFEKELTRKKVSPKVLDHKLKATQADLKGEIPANERTVVYMVSADSKKAEVKLKITN
jgi:hypothetical protein